MLPQSSLQWIVFLVLLPLILLAIIAIMIVAWVIAMPIVIYQVLLGRRTFRESLREMVNKRPGADKYSRDSGDVIIEGEYEQVQEQEMPEMFKPTITQDSDRQP